MIETVPDILARIVAHKRDELSAARVTREEWERLAASNRKDRRDFLAALRLLIGGQGLAKDDVARIGGPAQRVSHDDLRRLGANQRADRVHALGARASERRVALPEQSRWEILLANELRNRSSLVLTQLNDVTKQRLAFETAHVAMPLGAAGVGALQEGKPMNADEFAYVTRLDEHLLKVRQEMAALEEMGYLTHPHTSAGRVPTEVGYRFFVEHLLGETELPLDERHMIRHQFHQARLVEGPGVRHPGLTEREHRQPDARRPGLPHGEGPLLALRGEAPARTDPDDPFIKLVCQTAAPIYGSAMEIVPMSGGSGPNHPFVHDLNLPIATAGVGHPGALAHAPNENLRLDLYLKGARHITRILKEFA